MRECGVFWGSANDANSLGICSPPWDMPEVKAEEQQQHGVLAEKPRALRQALKASRNGPWAPWRHLP
jgi:hypothetical protein